MGYAQRVGIREFELRWERANAVVNNRFSGKTPVEIRKASVDLEDMTDIISAALMSVKCNCGTELSMSTCDVCGNMVIGCMHCHMEAHALELELSDNDVVIYESELQRCVEDHGLDKSSSGISYDEFNICHDDQFMAGDYYRSKELKWLTNHAM